MVVLNSRGYLSETESPQTDNDDSMRLINILSPTPLERDQVYIRSMYLCSNQLCESDWCRFSDHALDQIVSKVVGQSVLTGHDRKSLPVARFFKAQRVKRPELPDPESGLPTHWIRAWFYWLRETQGARDLALNIDGGIYREVSISWRYQSARCSICSQSLPGCGHVPGLLYDNQRCYAWIDDILDVLEGSLVYKGADLHTTLSGEHEAPILSSPPNLMEVLAFEYPYLCAMEVR